MEFSVKKFDLLGELNLTQGVVERKTTIPILSNLLFEASGSRLTITATDLELSIRTSCEAKVKKDGAGTIPAKKLLDLVRLLPEEIDHLFHQLVTDGGHGMASVEEHACPQPPRDHNSQKAPTKLLPMAEWPRHGCGGQREPSNWPL